ncbi:MAG: DNA primase [Eubacteriales bacterium]
MPYDLTEEKLEEIKDVNDIVDVIGEFIELKRTGTNYKALCPFHNEKTPSFVVSPEKQIYHCFGCGEGGDVLSFLMKHNNYSFIEAAEYLANKAGINLEHVSKKETKKKDILYEINREAGLFFYKNLSKSKEALDYFRNRGVKTRVIKIFGLGYALDSWEALYNHLKNKNYKDEDILKTGLIIDRDKRQGYYDRFRNRVIFPIIDTKKRIIGFGGRVLDNSLPKYLNSPDSEVFYKGRNLYNLNNALKNKDINYVILTEGYMDVIKLSSFGYNNTVASLGTSFTKYQVNLLKKYFDEFYIAYDSDKSGVKAAIKALNLFKNHNINAKVITFPDNMDPDDYITKYGKVKFKEKINNASEYFSFLDDYYSNIYDINLNKGKVQYIENFLYNVKNITNSIERELVIEKISEKTNISKENLLSEYNKKFSKKKIKQKPIRKTKDRKKEIRDLDLRSYLDRLLDLASYDDELFEYILSKYKDKFTEIFGNDFHINYKPKENSNLTNVEVSTDELDFLANKILIKHKEKRLLALRESLKKSPNNEELLSKINKVYKEINILRQGGIN